MPPRLMTWKLELEVVIEPAGSPSMPSRQIAGRDIENLARLQSHRDKADLSETEYM